MDELTKKRAALVKADDESKWLVRVSKDASLKGDLKEDVTKVTTSLEDLEQRLREKKAKLQRFIGDEQRPENVYDDLVDLISPIEFNMQNEEPTSLDVEDVTRRSQTQKVLRHCIRGIQI